MNSFHRSLLALGAAGLVAALVAVAPSEAVFARGFSARAKAFPVEPDPGQNQQSFAVRPVSADATATNPPAGSFGRAAVVDAGIIEGQFPPPEESFAACDSVSPNVPTDARRRVGPIELAATCRDAPLAAVRADSIGLEALLGEEALASLGLDGGSISSRVVVDGSGDMVWAESISSLVDLRMGALHLEEVRFRTRVEADGEPGAASADWSFDVVAADVDGVPVTIGSEGVRVDDAAVPAPLLAEAAAAVQEAFGQSPYSDVRVLEPEVSVADDGSSASVDGGGLHVFLTSSDNPAEREFLGLTLLGGRVEVAVGEALEAGTGDLVPFVGGAPRVGGAVAVRPPAPPVPAPPAAPAPTTSPGGEAPVQETSSEPAPPEIELATTEATRALAAPSSSWAVALVVGALLLALAVASRSGPLLPARRTVMAWADGAAERFFRG